MEDVLAVANKLIELGMKHGMPLTQMKLQKLLFFAQGWYLALTGNPLFEDDFEAWDYGPVVKPVYHEFREFGIKGIDRKARAYVPCGGGLVLAEPPLKNTENLEPFFDKIWQVYGRFNGNQLSLKTHEPDTPWTTVRAPYGNMVPRSLRIPKDIIRTYFSKKKKSANAS